MSANAFESFDLPPRRETFLARYPRNLKLAVTVVVFALMVLPPALMRGGVLRRGENAAALSVPHDTVAENLPVVGNKAVVDAVGPALNDQNDRSIKLIPAPDIRVTEDTAEGSLPRIGADNARPWEIYARPFNAADKRPRIAIVITDLGLSRLITDQTITQLPPAVTLSFAAEGSVVAAWGTRARQEGHEILLQIPMEPFDYPSSDPGPNALLSNLPNGDNMIRLLNTLRKAVGYVGVTTTSGSSFTADSTKFAPVLRMLHDRGLMVLDSRLTEHSVVADMSHTAGVPEATVTQRLDTDLTPDAIAAMLDGLEKTARQNGRAVGIAAATPLMVEQLQAWLKDLPERGIALAPLTAMVQ